VLFRSPQNPKTPKQIRKDGDKLYLNIFNNFYT